MGATTRSISSPPIILLLLLLVARPILAQNFNASDNSTRKEPPTISKSTAVVILVLISAFFFVGFISLYIRHCSDDDDTSRRVNPGDSVIFRGRQQPKKGLDPALIETFPILNYAAVQELRIGKHALECAVCLTEFEDDDSLRLLPHCDHVFHPDCIDVWLDAHTTCPVCRADLHAPILPHAVPHPHVHPQEPHVDDSEEVQAPCIQRAPTVRRNESFGAPRRLWGKIARSFSTGHVAVKQWENLERFRLRLPEEVRREVMSGKLQRANSMVVLPRETSSRRGYHSRTGFGEGSSRGRSDRGVLSFFSRALSFTSSKMASRQGSLRGSVRAHSTRLPV